MTIQRVTWVGFLEEHLLDFFPGIFLGCLQGFLISTEIRHVIIPRIYLRILPGITLYIAVEIPPGISHEISPGVSPGIYS